MKKKSNKRGSVWIWVLIIVVLLLVIGIITYYYINKDSDSNHQTYNNQVSNRDTGTNVNNKVNVDAIPSPPALPN